MHFLLLYDCAHRQVLPAACIYLVPRNQAVARRCHSYGLSDYRAGPVYRSRIDPAAARPATDVAGEGAPRLYLQGIGIGQQDTAKRQHRSQPSEITGELPGPGSEVD